MLNFLIVANLCFTPDVPPQVEDVLAFGMTRIASPELDARLIQLFRDRKYETAVTQHGDKTTFVITFPGEGDCVIARRRNGLISFVRWPWYSRQELIGEVAPQQHRPIGSSDVALAKELLTLCGIDVEPGTSGIVGEEVELSGRREWLQYHVRYLGSPTLMNVQLEWNSARITELSIFPNFDLDRTGWENLPKRSVSDEDALAAAAFKAISAFGVENLAVSISRFGYATEPGWGYEKEPLVSSAKELTAWILVRVGVWDGENWNVRGMVAVNGLTGAAHHHFDPLRFQTLGQTDTPKMPDIHVLLREKYHLEGEVAAERPPGAVVAVNLTSYAISAIENERGLWVPVTGGWQRAVPR